MPTKTLPTLEALAYLYRHNLTIDKTWTEKVPYQRTYYRYQTHITTKPIPAQSIKPNPPAAKSMTRPTCTICHKPKDDPAHATCLSVACLKVFFGKK